MTRPWVVSYWDTDAARTYYQSDVSPPLFSPDPKKAIQLVRDQDARVLRNGINGRVRDWAEVRQLTVQELAT